MGNWLNIENCFHLSWTQQKSKQTSHREFETRSTVNLLNLCNSIQLSLFTFWLKFNDIHTPCIHINLQVERTYLSSLLKGFIYNILHFSSLWLYFGNTIKNVLWLPKMLEEFAYCSLWVFIATNTFYLWRLRCSMWGWNFYWISAVHIFQDVCLKVLLEGFDLYFLMVLFVIEETCIGFQFCSLDVNIILNATKRLQWEHKPQEYNRRAYIVNTWKKPVSAKTYLVQLWNNCLVYHCHYPNV